MKQGILLLTLAVCRFASASEDPRSKLTTGTPDILIANSDLPFLIVDPKDIESFAGAITEPPGTYVAGVRHEIRSGSGIQQMDVLTRSTSSPSAGTRAARWS